ncbi:multidrug/solvent RND membrane fusion protein [Methylophaga frappieri]|uniref:Multidrug/solvent RND membrane fusion protein n=1 Tax=Methylophaga frappieri (strain ATCC BAA-2434 / DSM 25690 / JAM7) TaxID=754477 RepID=I1YJ85_METFJ|nr:efflux RND transporter periplasmic adaptor subunit [Methylophaga frappieri]AFJ02978.1 multidrug/solvent RND membrane fusion protein [Methylophaga frappieri]
MTSQSNLLYRFIPLLFAFGLLSACLSEQDQQQNTGAAQQKMAVNVVMVENTTVQLTTQLPARTTAIRRAEVRPQVDGIIEKRLFTEGAHVKAGEQLYQIEAAPYQAEVNNAKAILQRAKANVRVTERRQARYKKLLDDNAISQQEYDEALAAFEQAQAEVAVSNAALDTALINLRYTSVNAPIEGQIGISHVTEGALVTAGQSDSLATIHQLDPIYVDITQASRELLRLRRELMTGDLEKNGEVTVSLTLEDDTAYSHKGTLAFSEVNVNEMTGSIVMRAQFPNPDGLLLPGMYVRAEVDEGRVDDAILVPQKAVTFGREGQASVFVVNADNIVELHNVQIRRDLGQNWLIETGLNVGDAVIVEGLQKIGVGLEVEIANKTEQEGR